MNSSKTLAVLISARNLGDAAIAASFLEFARLDMPDVVWHVWCRPQMAFLFEVMENVEAVSASHFPMGTSKQFSIAATLRFLTTLRDLRRVRCSFSVDLVGDVREVSLGRLISRGRHYSPAWPSWHPFRALYRHPVWFLMGRLVKIDSGKLNVYEVYRSFSSGIASLLGLEPSDRRRSDIALNRHQVNSARRRPARAVPTIGIHPFASQECKYWTFDNWRELMRAMIDQGYQVVAFGAPSERAELLAYVSGILDEDAVITVDLQRFFSHIGSVDLLVGLDSFSIHAAFLCGVPAIVINGSNHPELFRPPGAKVLAAVAKCGFQPCMNAPRCEGTSYEYACTREVAVNDVVDEVKTMMEIHAGREIDV